MQIDNEVLKNMICLSKSDSVILGDVYDVSVLNNFLISFDYIELTIDNRKLLYRVSVKLDEYYMFVIKQRRIKIEKILCRLIQNY